MSCAPSYTYRPTFTPSSTDCVLAVYNKHRARAFAGGTYFRSIEQSSNWNDIAIKVEIVDGKHVLTITHPDFTTETFSITQVPNIVDPLQPCVPGIAELRALVNRPITNDPLTSGSRLIEMPERGDDIEFDPAGEDALCLSTFPTTHLTGGESGPTSSAGLSSLRTGPERSIIAIATKEAMDGTPITPPRSERLQQWNGTAWIEYSNTVPGACPV